MLLMSSSAARSDNIARNQNENTPVVIRPLGCFRLSEDKSSLRSGAVIISRSPTTHLTVWATSRGEVGKTVPSTRGALPTRLNEPLEFGKLLRPCSLPLGGDRFSARANAPRLECRGRLFFYRRAPGIRDRLPNSADRLCRRRDSIENQVSTAQWPRFL